MKSVNTIMPFYTFKSNNDVLLSNYENKNVQAQEYQRSSLKSNPLSPRSSLTTPSRCSDITLTDQIETGDPIKDNIEEHDLSHEIIYSESLGDEFEIQEKPVKTQDSYDQRQPNPSIGHLDPYDEETLNMVNELLGVCAQNRIDILQSKQQQYLDNLKIEKEQKEQRKKERQKKEYEKQQQQQHYSSCENKQEYFDCENEQKCFDCKNEQHQKTEKKQISEKEQQQFLDCQQEQQKIFESIQQKHLDNQPLMDQDRSFPDHVTISIPAYTSNMSTYHSNKDMFLFLFGFLFFPLWWIGTYRFLFHRGYVLSRIQSGFQMLNFFFFIISVLMVVMAAGLGASVI